MIIVFVMEYVMAKANQSSNIWGKVMVVESFFLNEGIEVIAYIYLLSQDERSEAPSRLN